VVHTDTIIDTRAQKMVSHTVAHYIIGFARDFCIILHMRIVFAQYSVMKIYFTVKHQLKDKPPNTQLNKNTNSSFNIFSQLWLKSRQS